LFPLTGIIDIAIIKTGVQIMLNCHAGSVRYEYVLVCCKLYLKKAVLC